MKHLNRPKAELEKCVAYAKKCVFLSRSYRRESSFGDKIRELKFSLVFNFVG